MRSFLRLWTRPVGVHNERQKTMRRLLSLFITALALLPLSLQASSPVDLTPLSTNNEAGCSEAMTGTATYVFNQALTGTTSSVADLGLYNCFSFSVTSTGGGSVQVYTSNISYTAWALYAIAKGAGSFGMTKVGRYVEFVLPPNSPGIFAAGQVTVTAQKTSLWYYTPTGGQSATIVGAITANQGAPGTLAWPFTVTTTVSVSPSGTGIFALESGGNLDDIDANTDNLPASQASLTATALSLSTTANSAYTQDTATQNVTKSISGSAAAIASQTNFPAGGLPVFVSGTAQGISLSARLVDAGGNAQGVAANPLTVSANITGIAGTAVTNQVTDGSVLGTLNALRVGAATYFYNPQSAAFSPIRVPMGNGTGVHIPVLVSLTAATTLWTPSAGNKFRLMGGFINFTGAVTSSTQNQQITFYDNATTITTVSLMLSPTASAIPSTTQIQIPISGGGYLSAVSNTALTCTLTGALTSASPAYIWISPMGSEGSTNP